MKKLFLYLLIFFSLYGCATSTKGTDLAVEYYNIGNAYYKLENYSKAVIFLKKAVSLDANFHKAVFNLSLALIEAGQPQEAEKLLKNLLIQDPGNQSMMDVLAYAYLAQQEEEEAVRIYQEILISSPENINARYNLALLLWKLGEKEKSLEEYHKILEISLDDHEVLYNIGELLLELEKYEDAVEILEQYLTVKPSDVDAYMLLAMGYRFLERYDRALEAYSDALTYDEKRSKAWFYSAQILLTRIEDPNKGLIALTQALDYGFKNLKLINELIESPDLLEKDKVESLLKERGLLSE